MASGATSGVRFRRMRCSSEHVLGQVLIHLFRGPLELFLPFQAGSSMFRHLSGSGARAFAYRLLAFALLTVSVSVIAQEKVVWSDQEKPIVEQLRGLRKLDDSVRAGATKDLALRIRQLPVVPNKLTLAMALANLSTEGDFGHHTLQEVTATLATAVREQQPPLEKKGEPDSAYMELASLVRYEHMQATSDNPQFAAAMSKLEADDAQRQNADFTRFEVEGIPKSFVYDRAGKLVAQSIDMGTQSQFLEKLAQAGLR
jgi:hypothetical protein